MAKNTDVLVKQLYPKVANSLDRGLNRYKSCISRFIGNRNKELFDLDIDYIQYEDYEIDIINKLIKDKIIKGEE